MKRGIVYCCDRRAGELVEDGGQFVFRYAPEYLAHPSWPAVSATLPKREGEYRAEHLFPFFHGLLAEGAQKERQCRELRIDEDDAFSRLLATSAYGAVGGVHVVAAGDAEEGQTA
jgi:serine/threonine-protein kinase HipA